MARVLSADLILEAGASVVASQGWETLSLRSVAADLGVTPMALYRHVPDSAALVAAVLDRIAEGMPLIEAGTDLGAELLVWARATRDYLAGFPGVAGELLVSWFESLATLRRIEDLLTAATRHGVLGFEAVAATNAVFTYVLMRVETERRVRSASVVNRQLRAGSDHLPLLTSMSSFYTTAQFDEHFEYGLRAMVEGTNLKTAS